MPAQPLQPSQPVAHLLALHDDIHPAESVLEADVYTLGRSPLCQIVVPRSIISRLHAKIEREGPRYLLVDAGSANGTFVNGQRLHAPHVLGDRDLIGLGAATALLRFLDPDPTVVTLARLRYDERSMTFSWATARSTSHRHSFACSTISISTRARSARAKAAPKRSGAGSTNRGWTPMP